MRSFNLTTKAPKFERFTRTKYASIFPLLFHPKPYKFSLGTMVIAHGQVDIIIIFIFLTHGFFVFRRNQHDGNERKIERIFHSACLDIV